VNVVKKKIEIEKKKVLTGLVIKLTMFSKVFLLIEKDYILKSKTSTKTSVSLIYNEGCISRYKTRIFLTC